MNSKAEELRAMSDDALAKTLEETHRQIFSLRLQVATRQTANHRELRWAKRRVQRIRTIQRERELAALLQAEEV